jgi:hypothetical protein
MSAAQESIPVRIHGVRETVTSGQVEQLSWDKAQRTRRALKALGICWGIALCTVLIPILHFILVPLFLISGPIVFFWVASQERMITGGKGICPECGKAIDLMKSPPRWPLSDLCSHCQARLSIERASERV